MILRIIDKETKEFLRDDFHFNSETEIALTAPPSQGLYQPRWNGESWEESASQEYIGSLKQPLVEEVPLDVRMAKVEQEQEQIVDVLAELLGV